MTGSAVTGPGRRSVGARRRTRGEERLLAAEDFFLRGPGDVARGDRFNGLAIGSAAGASVAAQLRLIADVFEGFVLVHDHLHLVRLHDLLFTQAEAAGGTRLWLDGVVTASQPAGGRRIVTVRLRSRTQSGEAVLRASAELGWAS